MPLRPSVFAGTSARRVPHTGTYGTGYLVPYYTGLELNLNSCQNKHVTRIISITHKKYVQYINILKYMCTLTQISVKRKRLRNGT